MTHIDTDRYQLAQHIETAGIEKELGVVTSYVGSGLGIALLFQHPTTRPKRGISGHNKKIRPKRNAIDWAGHIARKRIKKRSSSKIGTAFGT